MKTVLYILTFLGNIIVAAAFILYIVEFGRMSEDAAIVIIVALITLIYLLFPGCGWFVAYFNRKRLEEEKKIEKLKADIDE